MLPFISKDTDGRPGMEPEVEVMVPDRLPGADGGGGGERVVAEVVFDAELLLPAASRAMT